MFDAMVDFVAFGIVEAVKRSHQITGDAADPFEFDVAFFAATVRTNVVDNPVVSANRIPINRMVDRTVTDTSVFHGPNDLFKSIDVFRNVAVNFDIGNVSGIRQSMIRGFNRILS